MKNLKIKLGLFSLLAVLAVSVFMTSCEQQITTPFEDNQVTTDVIDISTLEASDQGPTDFILPQGFDNKTDEEVIEYLSSIDESTYEELVISAKVYDYFTALGEVNKLFENEKYGTIYNESHIAKYLTTEQVDDYNSFLEGNLEERWDCQCDSYATFEKVVSGYYYNPYPLVQCLKFDKYVQECHSWACPDRVHRYNWRRC